MSDEIVGNAKANEEKPKSVKKLTAFEPSIGEFSSKKRYWGCLVCKSVKNSIKNSKCSFCGSKRAVERFGIIIDDTAYMCRVHLEKSLPLLSLTTICDGHEKHTKIRLLLISENLEVCVRAAINAQNHEKAVEEKVSDTNQITVATDSEDLTLDLFHRVMKSGENYAYDGHIGQYVHVDTLQSRNSDDDSFIHTDLQYLKLMKREKTEMGKIVQEIVDRRSAEKYVNVVDSTADKLQEWKGKIPCALCNLMFPVAQLLGTISFKSVTKWKLDHNVEIPEDAKRSASNVYDGAKLCLFCTQFFDASYNDVFEVEKVANDDAKKRTKKYVQMVKNKESPLASIQIGVAIAELKHKKKTGGIRMKQVESPTASEIRRLDDERRKLNYLLAQKKFQKHAKILKLEQEFENSLNSLEDNRVKDDKNDAESFNTRRMSSSYASTLQTLSRSQSSEGVVGRTTGNNSEVSKLRRDSERHQRRSSGEGTKSMSALPVISQSSGERYRSLTTVKERSGSSSDSRIGKRRRQKMSRTIGISGISCSIADSAPPTADGDDKAASGTDDTGPVPQLKTRDRSTGHSRAANRKTVRGGKPEWVEVRSGDGISVDSSSMKQSVDRGDDPTTAAQLAESAKEIYSQKIEKGKTKKKETKKNTDGTFSRRRRALNDPRNALQTTKKLRKKPNCAGLKSNTAAVKAVKVDTARDNYISNVGRHGRLPSISESLITSSPHKVEIIAAHQTPNLRVAKKLKIRVKNKLVEPSAAIATILKSTETSELPGRTTSTIASDQKTMPRIRITAMNSAGDSDGCDDENAYADEEFDSDFDGASTNLPVSHTGIDALKEQFTSSDFFVSDDSAVTATDPPATRTSLSKKHTERSESPVLGTESGGVGSAAPGTNGVEDGTRPQDLSRPLKKKLSRKNILDGGHNDVALDGVPSSPSRRLDSATESTFRIASPKPLGIESISGRPISSHMGSRSSKRPTSSTLLPFYENTDPLIINSVPRSPSGGWGGMFGSPLPLSDCSNLGSGTPGSAAGRRHSRGLVSTMENIEGCEEHCPSAAEAGYSVGRRRSRPGQQALQAPTLVETLENGKSDSFEEIDTDAIAAAAAAAVQRGRRKSSVSLPKNTQFRESLQFEHAIVQKVDEVEGVCTDSRQHQITVNRKATMRRPRASREEIVVAIQGQPSSLDINILKATGAVERTIKKVDSFERFTKQMELKKKTTAVVRSSSVL